MKSRNGILAGLLIAVAMVIALASTPAPTSAQESPAQKVMSQKFVSNGVGTQGAGVLQTGELSTLSAAVASATRTEVVAAPSSGSTYIRGLVIEKSAGGTGVVTLSYGTGTNCGTGTTTIVVFTNPPIGTIPLGIANTAAKALCITTEGANTSARALTS